MAKRHGDVTPVLEGGEVGEGLPSEAEMTNVALDPNATPTPELPDEEPVLPPPEEPPSMLTGVGTDEWEPAPPGEEVEEEAPATETVAEEGEYTEQLPGEEQPPVGPETVSQVELLQQQLAEREQLLAQSMQALQNLTGRGPNGSPAPTGGDAQVPQQPELPAAPDVVEFDPTSYALQESQALGTTPDDPVVQRAVIAQKRAVEERNSMARNMASLTEAVRTLVTRQQEQDRQSQIEQTLRTDFSQWVGTLNPELQAEVQGAWPDFQALAEQTNLGVGWGDLLAVWQNRRGGSAPQPRPTPQQRVLQTGKAQRIRRNQAGNLTAAQTVQRGRVQNRGLPSWNDAFNNGADAGGF